MTELETISTPALLAMSLSALGGFLKKTPHVQDWMIPYILCVTGAVLFNFVSDPGIRASLLGFGAGLLAVGGHQLIRQATDGRREDTQFISRKKHAPKERTEEPPKEPTP